MEWCRSYLKNISLKSYKQNLGHYTTPDFVMCRKFSAPRYLKISILFEVQNFVWKVGHRKSIM